MVEVISSLVSSLNGLYSTVLSIVPSKYHLPLEVLFFAVLLALVSLFIWYFYKSLSQADLIELNLNKFNHSSHPFFSKLFAIVLYLVEYILIMPFIILIWFVALALVLILIAGEQEVQQIMVLTAALVAATRMLSYAKKDLAQDLAKMFPFATLSVFLLAPGGFDFSGVLIKTTEITYLFDNLIIVFLAVVVLEILLRLVHTFKDLVYSEKVNRELRPEAYSGD